MAKKTSGKKREGRYLIRFEATAGNIKGMAAKIRALSSAEDLHARITKIESGMSRADRLADVSQLVSDALGEVESLKEELESWREGLPENLQNGDKASQLDDAISQLEELSSSLNDAKCSSSEVDFPGMF